MKKNKLAKDFVWNTLGSGLASVTSLIFMIITTRINGTDTAGIFSICFTTSCIIFTIALYSGRTYQVTENDNSIDDNDYVYHRLISSLLAIIIAFLFGVIKEYNGLKLIILIILSVAKIIEAINDVFHGILQKNDKLDTVGKSLLIRAILNLISFLIIDILTKNIVLSCISLIIDDLIVLFLIDIKSSKKVSNNKMYLNIKNIKKIYILGFFAFAVLFINNYLYNIPRYAIDNVLDNEMQAIYGIIVMPATIIMLLNQFIIQPVIIKLKECFANNNKKSFLRYTYRIVGITFLIGIVSMIIAYFIGIPVLSLLYGLVLDKYLYSLLIIIFGATLYTIVSVFSNALIVFRKTKVQFYIYLIVTIISYVMSNYLVKLYVFNGAVYSYLIMMILLLIFYIIIYVYYNCVIWGEKNESIKI